MTIDRVSSTGVSRDHDLEEAAPAGSTTSAASPPPPKLQDLPTGVDAWDGGFERRLADDVAHLDENEALELSGAAQAKFPAIKMSGEASAKVNIKREPGGGFTVSADGEGAAGGEDGVNRLGLGAAVKYHCETAQQAADLARALMTASAVELGTVSNPLVSLARTGARALDIKSETFDSTQRVLDYAPALKEVRLDVFDRTKLSGDSSVLSKDSMKLDVRGSFTIDYAKNEIRQTSALVSNQKGARFMPVVASGEVSAKEAASVSLAYQLTPAEAQKVKAGTLSANDALAAAMARGPSAAIARGEVEAGGKGRLNNAADTKVKLSTELKLEKALFKNGIDAEAVLKALTNNTWTATQETGVGYSIGFDVGIANAEYRTTHKQTTSVTQQPTSLQAAWGIVTNHLASIDARDLEARRAASLLGAR